MAEFSRKLFHCSGVLLLLIPRLFPEHYKTVFVVLILATYAIELARISERLPKRLSDFFEHLARPSEKKSLSGSFYYILGVSISFLIFDPECAGTGLLVLALADPVAGNLHATGRVRFLRKSLLGTLGFFGVAACVLLLVGLSPERALLIAAVSALVENALPLNDNLSIPVAVSAMCGLLG